MSPRSKRRQSKKKHRNQHKGLSGKKINDTNNIDEPTSDGHLQATVETHVGNSKSKTRKTRFLDIVQETIKQAQSDYEKRLLTLFDNLLIISNSSSEKRNVVLEIILNLTSELNNYDADEIGQLEKKLQSKFMPSELRKVIVDENALESSFFNIMGSRQFGILLKGTLKIPDGSNTKVVIKTKNDSYSNQQIIEEAKIMARLDHKNVLKLLAFEKNGPTFAVEYMTLGNLRDALHEYTFSSWKLVGILRDVVAGMEYIAGKCYVHRDLKCKSILLDPNGECKIGEFELCRYVGDTDGVYEDKDMEIDVFYAAPETVETCKFTTKTDMWAMGLLAWEIYFISGDNNDPLLLSADEELKVFFLKGMLPNRGCPPPLWKFFKQFVLNREPQKRPTFTEVRQKLDVYSTMKTKNK